MILTKLSKRLFNFTNFNIAMLALFWVLPCYAQDVSYSSASDMLSRIAQQIPNVMRLVTAFAYVVGMILIFRGIIELKHAGESRTMMSQDRSLRGPVILIGVGVMLLYLPTSVQVGMSTFWSNPNPYGYVQETDQWGSFLNDAFLIVQLFGTIAFIRGLLILSHLHERSQPGTLAKGMTHIIGGILCINIYQFVQVVLFTLGIQTS